MTNEEWLKSLDTTAFAKFLCEMIDDCDNCNFKEVCKPCLSEWLKKEHK